VNTASPQVSDIRCFRSGCYGYPFTLADLLGEGYCGAFTGLLDDVHPGWADLVHAYQTH
jgi:hypothetical protein